MNNEKNTVLNIFDRHNIIAFLKARKIHLTITATIMILCIITASFTVHSLNKRSHTAVNSSSPKTESSETKKGSSEEITSSVISDISSAVSSAVSTAPVSSVPKVTKPNKAPVKKPATVKPANPQATVNIGGYKYNTSTDIDDNVFLDALVYTGYNIKKHRSDGLMWQYVLAHRKRGLGWLSNITYAGGSTGYETLNGKPNIKFFEKNGFVCASYVTYVYFNYLPNVAGIDTSTLVKPVRSTSANDWYTAAKSWINSGISRRIGFKATKNSSGFITFKPNEEIPIGSLLIFCNARKKSDYGSHVAIYAGHKNNNHWITHVGNKNGPEFCAVERMHFGPDPQWPIAIITPPSTIRMSALLEINVKDNNGLPVKAVKLTLKSNKNGVIYNLGTTNGSLIKKEALSYGKYTLSYTVPEGYTSDKASIAIDLTTASNSKNTVNIILNKKLIEPPTVSSEPSAAESSTASEAVSSSSISSAESGISESEAGE